MSTISDQIISNLKDLGVFVVLGMPEGLPLLASIQREKLNLSWCYHEGSAGFMADAVAQYTNNVGVCLSTLGPGYNLVSGIAGSYLERTRVWELLDSVMKQSKIFIPIKFDQKSIFTPITKYYTQIKHHRGDDQLRILFRRLAGRTAPRCFGEVTKQVARPM